MKSLAQSQSVRLFEPVAGLLRQAIHAIPLPQADCAIELRHLRYFVSVAEFRHFGKAASALHIAQPSLSRQIRDLENRLNVKLFDRGARGVSLTASGSLLLAESRRILSEFSLSLRRVRDAVERRGADPIDSAPKQ